MAITTTYRYQGREITMGEPEGEDAMKARVIGRLNEETGEIDFEGMAPTWNDLAAAFAHREETGIALERNKTEGKRLKLEDDEAQSALIRLGLRVRLARRSD